MSTAPATSRRFDHLVIAVRDLAAAVQHYRDRLGFEVRAGGRHTGRGTENALIRFGLDYLELIGVYDADEAERAGRGTLVEFLRHHEEGLMAYAVATSDIDAEAASLQRAGLTVRGPFAMERRRPDGPRLAWQLLWPGGEAYRRPWPFFIQWSQSDAERLTLEPPGQHANGAQAVREVAVAVHDLERGIDLYQRQLRCAYVDRRERPELAAEEAIFDLAGLRVRLLAPRGSGEIASALQRDGEGVYATLLSVRQLAATRAFLESRGVALAPAPGLPGGLLTDPAEALGARLVFQEASAGCCT